MLFSAGVAASAGMALAASVTHPVPVYIVLTAAGAISAGTGIGTITEGRRCRRLRRQITDTPGFTFDITPGAPVVFSALPPRAAEQPPPDDTDDPSADS